MLRPAITVILATSLDGKIADFQRTAARFSSPSDQSHLEHRIADADAVLFGAGTLRAYSTTLRISAPELLSQRATAGRRPQPIQIVCSSSGNLDTSYRFFSQPVPRWLLTTTAGALSWRYSEQFDRILIAATPQPAPSHPIAPSHAFDWPAVMQQLADLNIEHLAVLGGGTLVGSLLTAGLIDDLWITVCPLLLGGQTAPNLIEVPGWPQATAPRFSLITCTPVNDELFIHYRVHQPQHSPDLY
jgi:5-amino-6-(5-phosphoribosylamino)uracil reductase